MIAPQLTDAELAAVRAARSMRIVEYDGGSRVAMCGNTVLFRAGGEVSFRELWQQATDIRDADAAKKEAEITGTISLEQLRSRLAQ